MKESHIYQGSLDTFISTINVACLGLVVVGEGCGGVTQHTLHSTLWANSSPAAAGLHEMAGHSDNQCKSGIRHDLSSQRLLFERCVYYCILIVCALSCLLLLSWLIWVPVDQSRAADSFSRRHSTYSVHTQNIVSHLFWWYECFIQPINCSKKMTTVLLIFSLSYVSWQGICFVYATLCSWSFWLSLK